MATGLIDINRLREFKAQQDAVNVSFFTAKTDKATASDLGLVKVGDGLAISSDGTLSVNATVSSTKISTGDSLTAGQLYYYYE